MIGPLSRIIARYFAGALVSYGLAAPEAAALEPELALIAGAALGAISEGAYALAVRRGWAR